MTLPFNPPVNQCTGCGACYSVCPKKCISMNANEEGFIYPDASEACINCGMCSRVCPINKPVKPSDYTKKVYAAVTNKKNIWKRSASGGAFSEICFAWGDAETLVVGAAWDGLKVHHIGIVGVNNIAPLCKSKYVFSATEDTFTKIKDHLKQGKKTVFCGTPCQVDGLRHFLKHDYDNLLLIDLICHGVGSPEVFKTAMEVIGEDVSDEVRRYEFRAKRNVYEEDYLTYLSLCKSAVYVNNDPYIQLFLSQNCLRKSCGENCRYRNQNRTGDITIADFKGLHNIFPNLIGCKRNYSTIVINSPKGESILPDLTKSMSMLEASVDDVVKYNPLFDHHTWFSKDRDKFFQDFKVDKKSAIRKWTKPHQIAVKSWKLSIFDFLPVWLRRLVLTKLFAK